MDDAKIYQFPNEKYPSIVLSMNQSLNGNSRIFSWIYKQYLIAGVNEEKPGLLDGYELFNNYPNPFNPVTKIKFDIPKQSFNVVAIYDVLGKQVDKIFEGNWIKKIKD